MFKKYKRTSITEMRDISVKDISDFKVLGAIYTKNDDKGRVKISISTEDIKNGSPKIGDKIARNPLNHNDQWLIAEKYFNENFVETDLRYVGNSSINNIDNLNDTETSFIKNHLSSMSCYLELK